MSSASRNAYDHRLKQAIVETGDPDLFPELSIPESTARIWMRRGGHQLSRRRRRILQACARVDPAVESLRRGYTTGPQGSAGMCLEPADQGPDRRRIREHVIRTDRDLNEVARHVVAQVDIVQSNSLIERLRSQLRHRWLYLHQLDSFAGLERLLAAYFHDHNARIPPWFLAVGHPTRPTSGAGRICPNVFGNSTEERSGNGSGPTERPVALLALLLMPSRMAVILRWSCFPAPCRNRLASVRRQNRARATARR